MEEFDSSFDLVFHISDRSKAALATRLEPGERCIDARPRSFWLRHRTFLLAAGLGSVACLGLWLAVAAGVGARLLYYALLSVLFPVLLVGGIIQLRVCLQEELGVFGCG